MTVLENLYYGNIHPNERIVKEGSEYRRYANRVIKREQELRAMLSGEGTVLYEKIMEDVYAQMDISARESFVEGFRLGAMMLQEIVGEAEKQLAPLHPLAI